MLLRKIFKPIIVDEEEQRQQKIQHICNKYNARVITYCNIKVNGTPKQVIHKDCRYDELEKYGDLIRNELGVCSFLYICSGCECYVEVPI